MAAFNAGGPARLEADLAAHVAEGLRGNGLMGYADRRADPRSA